MSNTGLSTWPAVAAVAIVALAGPAAPAQVVTPSPGARVFTLSPGSNSFLGVAVAEVDTERAKALRLKEEHGVEITRLEEDSPASRAGLKVSDVVLEYNGQRVEGIEQFVRLVKETPVGRQVKMLISRDGNLQTVTATIGNRKSQPLLRSGENEIRFSLPRFEIPEVADVPRVSMLWRTSLLGIEAEAIEGQLAQFFGVTEGVLVRSVVKGSTAEKAGIRAGDVIVRVEDTKVATPREITNAMRAQRPKKTVLLTVVREQKEVALNVTLDEERSEAGGSPAPRRSVRAPQF